MSTLARSGADIAIPMRIERDPPTCAAIKIQDEFELGLGEWFADTAQGTPYVGTIVGVKSPNLGAIRALLRSIILGTPGIIGVQELNVAYDPNARTLAYDFAATDNTGAEVTGGNAGYYVTQQPPGGS